MFNPPDVAGWELNLGWINTAALLLRYNFADFLSVARTVNPEEPGIWVTHEQLEGFARANAKKTVKRLLSILGPLTVSTSTSQALREYLTTNEIGERVGFVPDDLTIDKKIRGLIHQVMCLPAFQMN